MEELAAGPQGVFHRHRRMSSNPRTGETQKTPPSQRAITRPCRHQTSRRSGSATRAVLRWQVRKYGFDRVSGNHGLAIGHRNENAEGLVPLGVLVHPARVDQFDSVNWM